MKVITHRCDLCGMKMAKPFATLSVPKPEKPGEVVATEGFMFQLVLGGTGGAPSSTYDVCEPCVKLLLRARFATVESLLNAMKETV